MKKRKKKGLFYSFKRWLTRSTNTEKIVWACLIHGFFWVDCSYALAWFDRVTIAEDLSRYAITEIIAVILIYAIKEGSANFSKYSSILNRPKPEPEVETQPEINSEEEERTI